MVEYLTQGVTRVEEVESILSNLVDLWDRDIFDDPDYEDQMVELMDRARIVLGRDEEFCAE